MPVGAVFLIAGVAVLVRGDQYVGWRGVIIGVVLVVADVIFGSEGRSIR